MLANIYLTFLISVLSYTIYRDILVYKTGKDSTSEKESLVTGILIFIGVFLSSESGKKDIIGIILLVYLCIVIINTTILNYLHYKKTKDKKIIKSTIIVDLILIGLAILTWIIVKKRFL